MKRILYILIIQLLLVYPMFAHDVPEKVWKQGNEKQQFEAPSKLSEAQYILEKVNPKKNFIQKIQHTSAFKYSNLLIALLLLLFAIFSLKKKAKKAFWGFLGIAIIAVGCKGANTNAAEALQIMKANDVSFLESVFTAFKSVRTRYDEQYFYVESNGIPEHKMMVGITSWQQQVPIDHDYSGNNAWAIPLQPELAREPLSTKENFMKGAIAIAVNGIPIFNPLNNRGEDANAVGELDEWGGHSGRADDYHYHIPPTHLQAQVGKGKPIAYALDGFPVYGETTEPLDENLGRFSSANTYQYHAVKEYPYLIAAMRGKVKINPRTRAPENEITPQARTRGVRPDLQPLRGAKIIGFESFGPQQYSLKYEVDSLDYVLNYGWDDTGNYSYEFVNPDGSSTRSTYKRK